MQKRQQDAIDNMKNEFWYKGCLITTSEKNICRLRANWKFQNVSLSTFVLSLMPISLNLDYQKFPLSEHVNSEPQFRHFRWHAVISPITDPHLIHSIFVLLCSAFIASTSYSKSLCYNKGTNLFYIFWINLGFFPKNSHILDLHPVTQ